MLMKLTEGLQTLKVDERKTETMITFPLKNIVGQKMKCEF